MYVRDDLADRCLLLEETYICTWIRVRGAIDGADLFVACVYFPCAGSPQWRRQPLIISSPEREFTRLCDRVSRYRSRGRVLLLGDFNARVGNAHDLAPAPSDPCTSAGAAGAAPGTDGVPVDRKTPDPVTDTHGRLLISKLCVPSQCFIANGRAPAGIAPNDTWTHRATNGSTHTVIDYCITDAPTFSAINSLSILPHDHNISDHRLIACHLRCSRTPPTAPDDAQPARRRLRLTPAMQPDWAAAVQSADVTARLSALPSLPKEEQAPALEAALGVAAEAFRRIQRCGPTTARSSGPRGNPWAASRRRAWVSLQILKRDGAPVEEIRKARLVIRNQGRRAVRCYLARFQQSLRATLRRDPAAFWRRYRDVELGGPTGATMREVFQHWHRVFSGTGRGALEEMGQPNPSALAQRLEADVDRGTLPPEQQQLAERLNTPFTEAEVQHTMMQMRNGAAAGLTGIGADLLKYAWVWVKDSDGRKHKRYLLVPSLTIAMNAAFTGGYPETWNTQSLSSIFKGKGSKADLTKFRPIQSQSALPKLFSMLVRARLDPFAETLGLRAEGQFGFRHDRGTADGVFVMRTLIDRYRLRRGRASHLYCCFVDFASAYDGVRRDLLLRLLASFGIHGNMLCALISMYWGVAARPRLGSDVGPPLPCTCGVRQGDPLSPLLFGLFIDRIEGHLEQHAHDTGVDLAGRVVRVLLYADDLVLLATSPKDLQTQLDALHSFCTANSMTVNVSKTECVVFGPSHWKPPGASPPEPPLNKRSVWTYNGTLIPREHSFKYLGADLHAIKGVAAATDRLQAQAKQAMWSMHARCRRHGIGDLSFRMFLYRTLVEPVTTYCAEAWSPDLMKSMDSATHADLQTLHNTYLKRIGHLRPTIPVSILSRESGVAPVARAWLSACVRLWNRIMVGGPALLKHALADNLTLTRSFIPNPTTREVALRGPRCKWAGVLGDADDDSAARTTWGGAWLRVLWWLSSDTSLAAARELRSYLHGILNTLTSRDPRAVLGLHVPIQPATALQAWDGAWAREWDAAVQERGSIEAEYARSFLRPDGSVHMYFAETSRFRYRKQAKALMRLRCCSHPVNDCAAAERMADPLRRRDTTCTCCGSTAETPEHILFECPTLAPFRTKPRYGDLCPPQPSLKKLTDHADQFLVAEFADYMFSEYKSHSSIDYAISEEGSDYSDDENSIIW